MTVATIPTLRFATDDFPARERISAWREFFGRGIVKLEIEPLTDGEFRSQATLRALPDLGIVAGSCSPTRYDRPRNLIDSDDVAFSIMLEGESNFAVCGREFSMGAGEAVLMGGGEGGCNEAYVDCRFIAIRVPKHAIAPAVPRLEDAVGRSIPAATPAVRLLRSYLGILDDADALGTPELRHHAVTHIHDLIALALGASRDATEAASGRGLRAARLKAIKDDIAANLDDESLSVGAIALRHQVTPRYVQKLFDAEGVTFTEYMVGQRLARAHRMLGDPRQAERTISAIAFDVGFGDLSYFNRTFRRRYGATPSDLRAQAQSLH